MVLWIFREIAPGATQRKYIIENLNDIQTHQYFIKA